MTMVFRSRAVLTFKTKQFPHPGVGNIGNSDEKVQVRVGTLTGSASGGGGGTLGICIE